MTKSLGDRMKGYENSFRHTLPKRMPTIIRLDGRCFSNYLKRLKKPFDEVYIDLFNQAVIELCKEVHTVQMAYIQSDEVSLLLHPYKNLNTEPWFSNNIQKITSISASILTANFNMLVERYNKWQDTLDSNNYIDVKGLAFFDSRVFILPEAEVCNMFIWRQKDQERNSIQMLAQSLYSHKQLQHKKTNELNELCFQKGHNWNDLPTYLKRGRCIIRDEEGKWVVDNNIPIFSKDRNYIEKYLETDD